MGVKASSSRQCKSRNQDATSSFAGLVRQLVACARREQPQSARTPSEHGSRPRQKAGLLKPGPAAIGSAQNRPPAAAESSTEVPPGDVLFECEVDGVRCVLARVADAPVEPLSLSPREQEIARMIAKGFPNKAIAAVLEISVWTISTHLRRLFAKLGVNSRAAMVAKMHDHRML
jgi:DNA-binding NarL/FixJ family response regulator